MGGEMISFTLRIGSTAVLARLLIPEDFGLIGMVVALTGFAKIFKDLGLSDATIQHKDITHEKVSTLFWINVLVGFLIMIIIAALSPLIAWFYNDPRLIGISLTTSTAFLFSGLTVQHQALICRQMRFGQIAMIEILSIALGIALGIGLAYKGFGYWALVWKEVSTSAFMAVGSWLMCRWLPGLPKRGSGVGSMLRFGRDITGFNVTSYFSHSLDKILIGRFNGPRLLGLYGKAFQLMVMPVNQIQYPISRVSMSALSSLQNEPAKYRQYYRKLISLLSFVYMPVVVYLGIYSENIILLVLGEKWIEAAAIFKILAFAAFIEPISSTCDVVLVSCGKTKRFFRWGVASSISLIVAFSVGISWGPIGVALSYAVANYAIFGPSLWYRFKETPITVPLFFQEISLPLFSSIFMGIILILLSKQITLQSNIAEIALSLGIGAISYCGIWCVFPGGRHKLLEFITYPFVALNLSPSFVKKFNEKKIA
jgi:O-antigen/teichoic acid export membrane protein